MSARWRNLFKRQWNVKFEHELNRASRNINFVWVKNLTIERKASIAGSIVKECAAEITGIVQETGQVARVFVTDPFHWYPQRSSQLFVDDEPSNWKDTLKNTVDQLKIQKTEREALLAANKAKGADNEISNRKTPVSPMDKEPVNMKVLRDDQIAKKLALKGFSSDTDVQDLILRSDLSNNYQLPFTLSVVDIPETTEDGHNILLRLCERFPSLVDVNKQWVLNVSQEHSFFEFFHDIVSLNVVRKFVENISKKQAKMENLRGEMLRRYNFSETNLDSISLEQASLFLSKMIELPETYTERIRSMNICVIKVVEREDYEENAKDSTADHTLIPFDFEKDELMECFSRSHTYQPINSSQQDFLKLRKETYTKNVVHCLYGYFSAQKMRNPAVVSGKKRKLEEMLNEAECDFVSTSEEQCKKRKIEGKIEELEAELTRPIPFFVESRETFM